MINVKKFILLCGILTLIFDGVIAQPAEVQEPSVNTMQFYNSIKSDIGLHIGQPFISIPIFNLKGRGIDIPISISFNGGNITNESEASNIGLGWSLLAGGVISKTIKDRDDFENSSSDDIQNQYYDNYLVGIKNEQNYNLHTDNLFDMAMDALQDKEPDIMNYSFLGFSGDICYKINEAGDFSFKMYPDLSFRMEKTESGFKVIDNNGIQYFFESIETKTDFTLSWFLTKILTNEGGIVTFQYTDDFSYDLNNMTGASSYATFRSKRLTRIDFDYGYVTFSSAPREDISYSDNSKKSKRITGIRLFDTDGNLLKGYHLENDDYFLDEEPNTTTFEHKRLKLNSIREFNRYGDYLPPYEFEYDYAFRLPKNSTLTSEPYPYRPKNCWAVSPIQQCIVDRLFSGQIGCWLDRVQEGPYYHDYHRGLEFESGENDGYTIDDYLCLTKIIYPSGGSESYEFEEHDFSLFTNQSRDTIGIAGSTWKGTPYAQVRGRRVKKKEISDATGNIQKIAYRYCLHDENYHILMDGQYMNPKPISSGVLVNPSIYYSTMYKPVWDGEHPRLVASSYYTPKPQNKPSGSAVYYSQVEEESMSASGALNGKKIYYFNKAFAQPAENYIYLNYGNGGARNNYLLNIPNTLYGNQTYYDELAFYSEYKYSYLSYPIGQFYEYDPEKGKVIKEITLDKDGNLKRKIKNYYSSAPSEYLYGLIVHKFIDTDTTNNPYPSWEHNRYLISKYKIAFGSSHLDKRVTTRYYPQTSGTAFDSVTIENTFNYSPENLLKSASTEQSDGEIVTEYYVYPTDFTNVSSGFIKEMRDANIIGKKVEVYRVKNGSRVIAGTHTKYKTGINLGIEDEVYTLSYLDGLEFSSTPTDFQPSSYQSNYSLDNNYNLQVKIDKVFEGKVLQYHNESNIDVSYIWGYDHRYPIAKIENATYDQVMAALNTDDESLAYLQNYSESQLRAEMQKIRDNIPEAMVTSYTYEPLVGIKSATDPNGRTTEYVYDNFYRLKYIKDFEGNVLQRYEYNYAD